MLPQLILLEIRSIRRTKRLRQLLFINTLVAVIFSINLILDSSRLWINVLGKAFIILIVAASVTPFTFSKDGAFYPALQSRPMSFFRYVQAKYQVAIFFCFLSLLVVHTFDLLAGRFS
jgi:flagellar biosynthesis protein FlhB